MKLEFDTKKKEITILEDVTLEEILLFVAEMELDLKKWKLTTKDNIPVVYPIIYPYTTPYITYPTPPYRPYEVWYGTTGGISTNIGATYTTSTNTNCPNGTTLADIMKS